MKPSLPLVLWVCALVAVSLISVPAHAAAPAFKAGLFDPPRDAPAFSLQGSDGRPLSISQFKGRVVLLAFGYSSCTAVCPVSLATYAAARRQMGAAAADVQVVYITVDPERDVPARLNSFLKQFDPTFIGGTGQAQALAEVRKQYGISAEKIPAGKDYGYSHSSFTYLIDRAGRIRALMPYGHAAADYVNDLSILLRE
jgi:protein SCO1/2